MFNIMGEYGYGYGFGFIPMIIFWFIIVIGIIFFIQFLNKNQQEKNGEKTPFDILKERYAKGEISKKEFEEKKKDLRD